LVIVRTLQICWAATRLIGSGLTAWFFARSQAASWPSNLRRALEHLGPTFVKLGQALSERRDLLPLSLTAELSKLQGQVAPFSELAAAKVVEAEFGAPQNHLFASFDGNPVAAASIAQVHRAVLHDGREVAVKILRPGVRKSIDQDMRILVTLMAVGSAVVPALRKRQSVLLVRELWRNLRRETDLEEEARNIHRFAVAFKGSKTVFIPDVVGAFSSPSILVEEFGSGRGIADPSLADQAETLSKAFLDFYMRQFFTLGRFHADPHPGNIFVMADGRLCFHDFGAVGTLDARAREALLSFIQAFTHQDADWLAEAATDLGLLTPVADRDVVVRAVEAILSDLRGVPLKEWSVAGVMLGIARAGGTDGLVLPPYLAALMRTIFTAEGTLRLLNPDLNMLEAMSESGEALLKEGPFLGRIDEAGAARLKWEAALALRASPTFAAKTLHRVGKGVTFSINLPDVRVTADRLGRAADRIALALVTLGLYIAASLLMQHSIGPRIFGDLPLLGTIGYTLALWFTLRLVVSISRSGGL
jgi:ubiquinone biosynthesis protein